MELILAPKNLQGKLDDAVDRLQAALWYAAKKGWAVFPLQPGSKEPHGGTHGHLDATADPTIIRELWQKWPSSNIALACAKSGILAVDIDSELKGEDGYATWIGLRAEHGFDDDTITNLTPSGGSHLLFTLDPEVTVTQRSLGPGVHTRRGGYIVLPPSRLDDRPGQVAGEYVWDVAHHPAECDPAPLPEAVLNLLIEADVKAQAPSVPAPKAGNRPGDRWASSTTWAEILEPHGWKAVRRAGDVTYWRRPGKDEGHSATTGHKGHDVLYVFSVNAQPFEEERGYSKFHAYALLNHGGDFKAATKAVVALGYGGDSPQDSGGDGLPEINVAIGDLPRLTQAAWEALLAANDPPQIFRYGGLPTRIELDDLGTSLTRGLDQGRVRYALARVANWVKVGYDQQGNKTCAPVPPPVYVVQDVLASPDPPLPVLTRVVAAPVFAPDGTLQTEPGYHPASHTYYEPAPGFTLPEVPTRPTSGDLEQAKLILDELLGDFPFTGEGERATAVALLLLPFVRDLIPGSTPLHLIEAPTPGTGKTLLADVLAWPALGRPIPAMAEGHDEDEWRKRITSKLRDGPTIILIDNLRQRLESAALSAAVTAPVWEDRVLGLSEMIRLPVRCAWVATGNNPTLSDEMTRRTVRIRLDARMEHPWLREDFRHPNLRGWTADHRGELVWAALTLVQAWLSKGQPKPRIVLGMFEDWAQVIAGILKVAEIPGFLSNLGDFYDQADEESATWRAFVELWWDTYGDVPVRVADLWELVAGGEDIIPLPLGDGSVHGQKIRLGLLLRGARARRFGPYRIERAGTHNRATQWRLTKSTDKI